LTLRESLGWTVKFVLLYKFTFALSLSGSCLNYLKADVYDPSYSISWLEGAAAILFFYYKLQSVPLILPYFIINYKRACVALPLQQDEKPTTAGMVMREPFRPDSTAPLRCNRTSGIRCNLRTLCGLPRHKGAQTFLRNSHPQALGVLIVTFIIFKGGRFVTATYDCSSFEPREVHSHLRLRIHNE
jgi:hypothetical protein